MRKNIEKFSSSLCKCVSREFMPIAPQEKLSLSNAFLDHTLPKRLSVRRGLLDLFALYLSRHIYNYFKLILKSYAADISNEITLQFHINLYHIAILHSL